VQKSEVLSLRNSLSQDEIFARSERACQRFLSFADRFWKPADFHQKTVGLYSPVLGELNPSSLKKSQIFSEAFFAYPRIKSLADRTMDFVIPSHESDFIPGRYGILEPRVELPSVVTRELVLIIVPGLVFGPTGERVGMGAGFYDRFLALTPKTLRIALAYDFQLSPHPMPLQPWDMKMDGIFSETQEILANLG